MAEEVLDDLRDFSRLFVFGRVHGREYNRKKNGREEKVGEPGLCPDLCRFKVNIVAGWEFSFQAGTETAGTHRFLTAANSRFITVTPSGKRNVI